MLAGQPHGLCTVTGLIKLSLMSKFKVYIPFNSQGRIRTGPQHCHLWELNPHSGD